MDTKELTQRLGVISRTLANVRRGGSGSPSREEICDLSDDVYSALEGVVDLFDELNMHDVGLVKAANAVIDEASILGRCQDYVMVVLTVQEFEALKAALAKAQNI